jgi:small redox-active disulfide protein 2
MTKEKVPKTQTPVSKDLQIELLGIGGCPNCKRLEENTKKAIEETKSKANVSKVTDINKVMGYGIMSFPGLVINGKVKCYGRVPTTDEIKKWF